jgi:hypothetical protein
MNQLDFFQLILCFLIFFFIKIIISLNVKSWQARLVHDLHNIILWQINTKKTTQTKESERQK